MISDIHYNIHISIKLAYVHCDDDSHTIVLYMSTTMVNTVGYVNEREGDDG